MQNMVPDLYVGDLVRYEPTGETYEYDGYCRRQTPRDPATQQYTTYIEVELVRASGNLAEGIRGECLVTDASNVTLVQRWQDRNLAYVDEAEYYRWGRRR